jgi:hypothetical protein
MQSGTVAGFLRPPRFPCQFSFHQLHHSRFVDKACLLRRCLAIDLLLFHAFASAGMCLAISCLAMGMARTTQKTILAITFVLSLARISGVAYKWVYMSQYNTIKSTVFLCVTQYSPVKVHRCFGGILPPFPGSKSEANNQQEATEQSFSSYS